MNQDQNSTFLQSFARPEVDLRPIAQITADAFAGGQHVEELSQQYIGNCHYDWQTSRLIWDGNKLVHHWCVWGYPMRLSGVQLKVAGVGAVVTLEAYRQQGLMQTAALASFQAMQENGYDLSILRGRHYAKFGYVRAWNYV
ncbi:MAG: GNAT family N-acetyltransferase, partial [Anaerolineales bacterium]|nr:GNAT family N-acetyltransferase [Anaerolineales bacterium]